MLSFTGFSDYQELLPMFSKKLRSLHAGVLRKILAGILALAVAEHASAAVFVSLKSSNANLRVGPGKEYPVSWIFVKSGLPAMLTAEFEQWRKVKFADGIEGWIHQNMISPKNTAIVVVPYAVIYKHASGPGPVARAEKNVIVRVLQKDKGGRVKAEAANIKGWIRKQDLWGVGED
ncbi:MAG: hypothetical protein LBO73_04080 [Holosporaceae bacterium]|jgi:SH3-like domain-containing protein|nr:hypothetical protein [Holosporaceae bacterium]